MLTPDWAGMEPTRSSNMPFLMVWTGIRYVRSLLAIFLKLHPKLVMKISINLMKKTLFIDRLKQRKKLVIGKLI